MGFENCHPAVNLIFFAAALYGSICFDHPIFIAISWLTAFAYGLKRRGKKGLLLSLALLPAAAAFALYYAAFHHFGVTAFRQNFIGNDLTLESLAYGLSIGIRGAAVCLWCSSLFHVVTSDKIVYLLGRISPKLCLFFTILLRLIPRIGREARRIDLARQGIGRGAAQGNALRRLRNALGIVSALVTWLIQALALESDSMRSRGSSLHGRTAYAVYRFDNRDRAFVIALFFGIILGGMGIILDSAEMYYDPCIIWKPLSGVPMATAVGYGFLCLLPLGLEMWTQWRFRQRRNAVK